MEFSHTIEVGRPVAEVFAYWVELERASEWATPVVERRKLTDGPTGVGTRFSAVDQFPGRKVRFELEITAFEPDKRVAAAWSEPMGGGWETTFEKADAGCEVTLRASMRPTGLMKLLSPILAPWAKRQMRNDLEAFKQQLETPTR